MKKLIPNEKKKQTKLQQIKIIYNKKIFNAYPLGKNPKKDKNSKIKIKLNKILIKNPNIKMKINVMHTIKSNTKSNNIKSKSNHHNIKS